MASSWFIKNTKNTRYDWDKFILKIGNTLYALLYKYFPLPKETKDKIHFDRIERLDSKEKQVIHETIN